jgi:hypothetical protein
VQRADHRPIGGRKHHPRQGDCPRHASSATADDAGPGRQAARGEQSSRMEGDDPSHFVRYVIPNAHLC